MSENFKFTWAGRPDAIWDTPNDTHHATMLMIKAQLAILISQSQTCSMACYVTQNKKLLDATAEEMSRLNKSIHDASKCWAASNDDVAFLSELLNISTAFSALIRATTRQAEKTLTEIDNGNALSEVKAAMNNIVAALNNLSQDASKTAYEKAVDLINEIRTSKAGKACSINDAIRHIRGPLSKADPFRENAVAIRAEVKSCAKKTRGGEDMAWRSIAKMAQPSYAKRKKKKSGRMIIPILYKGVERELG